MATGTSSSDKCMELDKGKKKNEDLKTLHLALEHLQHFSPSSRYGSELQQGGSPFSASQNWFPAPTLVTATPISHHLNGYATTDLL